MLRHAAAMCPCEKVLGMGGREGWGEIGQEGVFRERVEAERGLCPVKEVAGSTAWRVQAVVGRDVGMPAQMHACLLFLPSLVRLPWGTMHGGMHDRPQFREDK